MLLTIDCGNTNTVFSLWEHDVILQTWRTLDRPSAYGGPVIMFWLSTLMQVARHYGGCAQCGDFFPPCRAWCSICGFCATAISTAARLWWASPNAVCRSPPRVEEGVRPGPDRLANAAGAFQRHGGHVVVVDFGTATKISTWWPKMAPMLAGL